MADGDADGAANVECRWDGRFSSSPCAAIDAGGWRLPAHGADAGVPIEWLPDKPCAADTIHASQFDIDIFLHHYLLHPRPLLIRGGAAMPAALARAYTREGLLEVASDLKFEAYQFPTAKEYDGSTPLVKTMRDYIDFLEGRSEETAASNLHYVFHRVVQDSKEALNEALNFTSTLPGLLAGKVDHIGTTFYLGGVLMGFPPHHHSPVVNSLVHGRKLWFLQPPGEELVVHEAMYDYLLHSGGAPGAVRCIQEAGDLLFVPRSWTHGTLCLGDCIGASHEFSHKQYDLRD